MHIEFKKLILHNFMSFGDAELVFKDDGFIKVTGFNYNTSDNATSNGSGKSSLWEGIVWALCGETIRGAKQVVNIYGEDGCFVELEFKIDNKEYRVLRSKDHKLYKNSLQIFLDGQDVSGKGSRDSTKILQQHLPDLTSSLIGSVIVLGQGLPQKFTSNTPSGRKEVLEQLSKSDFMIEDLKNRVSSRKSDLSSQLRMIEDNIVKIITEQTLLKQQISSSEELLYNLDADTLNEKCVAIKSEVDNMTSNIKKCRENIEVYTNQLVELKQDESELIIEESSALSTCKNEYDSIASPLIQTYNEKKAQLSIYKSELSRIQNIKDVCPTCGQRIEGVHKPPTYELERSISEYETSINDLSKTINNEKQLYDNKLISIQSNFRNKKLELGSKVKEVSTLQETEKTNLLNYTNILEEKNSEFNNIQKQLTEIQTTIELNKKIIHNNNDKLVVLNEEFMYNNKQRDIAQSHIEVVSKFDTALKRDFRGYLLSTVIEYIQARAMQYSKVIFDTDKIGFCLNGNNIDITYMNKAYENLSGGEKQKIDLIIQFSIRDMLSSQLNFTSNILVLDEVFDSLDNTGCSKVIDMISSLKDVNNVFIVTHRKDLSIPNDMELIVAKSPAGFSELRR